MSPTILMRDYFKNYTYDEFLGTDWRKEYMNKNKPLFEKYIHIIEPWYQKHKRGLSKREIWKVESGKLDILKKTIVFIIIQFSYGNLVFVSKKPITSLH